MANFNEAIKATKSGRISVASYCDIVICKTMKEFQKAVCNNHMNSYFMCSESKYFNAFCRAEHPKNEMETVFDYPYMEDNYQSLHIEYKSTHRNAWMYEREEERKTRDAVMIVGGRGGG